jgi:hypothetical protein
MLALSQRQLAMASATIQLATSQNLPPSFKQSTALSCIERLSRKDSANDRQN